MMKKETSQELELKSQIRKMETAKLTELGTEIETLLGESKIRTEIR